MAYGAFERSRKIFIGISFVPLFYQLIQEQQFKLNISF